MNARPLARYETTLRRLAGRHRLRTLSPRAGLDFASNDYLGLASSTRLTGAIAAALARGVPVGAGGSRLLRGNDPEHEALEAEAAAFFRTEGALFFGGGYVANVGLLTTLPQQGDLIVLDALAHASMHEGARAARAVTVVTPHNDVDAMDQAITTWRSGGDPEAIGTTTHRASARHRSSAQSAVAGEDAVSRAAASADAAHATAADAAVTSGAAAPEPARGRTGRVWIVVESLYSMDGDRAPLADLVSLADRHEAFLLVDEAHATGVFGEEGRGLSAPFDGRENLVVLHTCGKALGAAGALVTAPRTLCDYLVNRCRAFIYATAPSPLMAAAVRESLRILREEPERRETLTRLIAHAGRVMRARSFPHIAGGAAPTGSPIQPIIVGDNERAMTLAAALQARGFDVRGVRPPTVPEGTARLRLSLTVNVDEAAVSRLFEALGEEMERLPA